MRSIVRFAVVGGAEEGTVSHREATFQLSSLIQMENPGTNKAIPLPLGFSQLSWPGFVFSCIGSWPCCCLVSSSYVCFSYNLKVIGSTG